MYNQPVGRQYSRYSRGGNSNHVSGGGGQNFSGRRRFRGQYVRSRVSPDRQLNDDHQHIQHQQLPPQHHHAHNTNTNNNTNYDHNSQRHSSLEHYAPKAETSSSSRQNHQRNSQQQQDIEQIKDLCSKLSTELDLVKNRINDIANNLEAMQQQQQLHYSNQSTATLPNAGTVIDNKRKKTKLLRKRGGDDGISAGQKVNTDLAATQSNGDNINGSLVRTNDRKHDRPPRRNRREYKEREKPILPPRVNDDSTTQAADPSSEDKVDGEDGRSGERVKRVFRRRKPQPNRKGYNNRRRRMDSSERNSNDTSPQNEANGDDYRRSSLTNSNNSKSRNNSKRNYPELSENDLEAIIQVVKRNFLASEISSVRKAIDEKGPVVAKELASAILDHAICDVTSPTKLSEIANNIFKIIVSDIGGLEFQQGFYSALGVISKREEDIAIDAPRYMDTLGQVLGQCVVPMNTNKYKQVLKKFLNKCLQSYGQQSRAQLLASTMRGVAGLKTDRFAKEVWDQAGLNWSDFLEESVDLQEFLEAQDVKFTIQRFSPEPQKTRKTPEEIENFADTVTDLVERGCTPQELDNIVQDLELEASEQVDYLGTLIYGIVRGCLVTESGDYKIDTNALNKYSSILKNQRSNKEQHDSIALVALTALTKLWHQYNCPQNLMSNILIALHNHGTASHDALKTWLDSDDLKNIPGIGAARLNSKRCIEELGALRNNST